MREKRAERCGMCRYWVGWPGYGELKGNCRRHAPAIVEHRGGFPFMEGYQWCGDFEPALPSEEVG